MKRVHESSKYVIQCALNTTPWPSISAYRTRIRLTNGAVTSPQHCAVHRLDRADHFLAQCGDVVVGQRAVERAESQREREAHLAGAERVGAEHVEEVEVFEPF